MAEAAVESPPCSSRFYCHQCSTEITPNLPDYTCPTCNSGFIEEVTVSNTVSGSGSNASLGRNSQDPASRFEELWTQTLLGPAFVMESQSLSNAGRRNGQGQNLSEGQPGPSGTQPTVRLVRPARNPYLEGLISYFLSRLGDQAVQGIPINMFQLHGNPADYAWGAGGLDTIITQLLNQLESSGPPPAEPEKINGLPTVKISESQVEHILQCSICMEDFHLDEEVKRLPCDHHYHEECIIRWLELHGTCPVCRKDLNGQDTSTKDEALMPPLDSNTASPPDFAPSSASNTSMDSSPSLD
ncbi:hypothetical protein C0Q70_20568 [Pomacea canaliculata]|uniref:RING-type E3 ubiquitin transferase n=1 Tax=Pomacea canaliculata TaxID=400727 RepID=A0A2T7NFX1_POMCA|nr:E3 ubiquitin-protein ligase RNF115-like [Pomacea canaliculata]PVD20074.1 hypothetical protein C0Q70_20568 [Pomacea canaliculata]